MARLEKIENFARRERTKFLRILARELKNPEIKQVVVACYRRDGAVAVRYLQDRGLTHEVLGILERAKLEVFADLIESRRLRGDL